jgi:ABC-type sugar transport system ATPase subunit
VAAGRVRLNGRNVTHLPPASRGVGYVPQDAALFDHLTVADNLGFALDVRGDPPTATAVRVRELAGWLGIEHLLPRRAAGLSGGEAQRVALAAHPAVLLLDEPLIALDEAVRDQLIGVLQGLRDRREVTVLHVTHSRTEAAALGEAVFRPEAGRAMSASDVGERCRRAMSASDVGERGASAP